VTLPPLYKYLDVVGAKLTLGNGTLKHSKPSDFNDVEDLTIQSIFPIDIELALKMISTGIHDVILQHLDDEPTCSSPTREKLAVIQQVYRANPSAAKAIKGALEGEGIESIYDIEAMRENVKRHIEEINEHMQDYRILCVTVHRDSERMWSVYAEGHKGIALRIEPSIAKDSIFKLFRPVNYRIERPPLYDDPLDFVADGLFGDKDARTREIVKKIIYAKTLDWQCEGEFRLAIPIQAGKPPWNTLPYHPEEITELYLGCAMNQEDKEDIVEKAKAINPQIAIFQAVRGADASLTFHRI